MPLRVAKNAKLHLSPCQAAVGFAVLLLPRPLFLTLSKQLEQILFYWGFYQVQEIPAAPAPKHFLSLCGVLRCHPTRLVRRREFALSVSNWILNQTLEKPPSLQPVLWHFKWADKSIFTSGRQAADLTQWKLVCESGFKYSISSRIVDLSLILPGFPAEMCPIFHSQQSDKWPCISAGGCIAVLFFCLKTPQRYSWVINATFMLSFPAFPIVADAEKAFAWGKSWHLRINCKIN